MNLKNLCWIIIFVVPAAIGVGIYYDSDAIKISSIVYMALAAMGLVWL